MRGGADKVKMTERKIYQVKLNMKKCILSLILITSSVLANEQKQVKVLQVPGSNEFSGENKIV